MNRIAICLVAISAVFFTGCSSNDAAKAEPQNDVIMDSPAQPEASPAKAPTSEIKVGSDMAEVKEMKGAPEDSKHGHGPDGAELDIWTYKDATITFVNGKVSKIE